MSADVECPYCGESVEINHDDGFGYEEDRKHEQQCHHCDKTFVFTTTISVDHEAAKADCLNEGGQHAMRPVVHYPIFWPDWMRCVHCDHEVKGNARGEPGRFP